MAKKLSSPESAGALLAAIEQQPARRRELFADALTGRGRAVIEAAIKADSVLRAEFRAALTDVEGLDRSPWLVQYAKRLDVREAIPELVVIARADRGSKSEQAAQALVAFADRASLDALATNVASQRWTQGQSIQALFLLGADAAFTRLSADVAAGGPTSATTLWHLAQHPDIVARDPRWIDVTLAALRTAAGAEAARAWDREHDPRHSPRELVPDFPWPVAPDGFTRAGLSGGPPYAFVLPGEDADPFLSNAPEKPRYAQFVARELRKAAGNLARRA